MDDKLTRAIEAVKANRYSFCKFVSPNDAGDTGGHQAGLYIPKNSISLMFDKPGIKGENKEKLANITWDDGKVSECRFIYYGQGSRNEYRITRLGRHFDVDDLVVVVKQNEDNYLGFVFTDDGEKENFLNEFELSKEDTNSLIVPEEIKIQDGYYKIRPAGRHITTIGKDLIKDKYAAIVELVKNAYDADSPYCRISLLPFKKNIETDGEIIEQKGIKIVIKDEGHGMSFDIVTDKWMVPSTDDKLLRKNSPGGRRMQGRKGVGRYAASIIGDDLVLQTVDREGNLTTLYLIWENFENAKYLEDVDVLIENYKTKRKSGTEIIIVGDEKQLSDWNERQIQNLKFELKKLIPPIDPNGFKIDADTENFKISLELGDFIAFTNETTVEHIEPYPLFELYDYRISGIISSEGIATLTFENKRINSAPPFAIEPFKINLNQDERRKAEQAYCGELKVDFRIFDRDPASIDGLIERGLKDPTTGQYVGKREARLILDNFNGIGVYRNGFRIRPLGDAGYDWLELDKERVQNPSVKIGSDQIIGFIHIQSEQESGLEEKSARDGLRETSEYFGLQEICKKVLVEVEIRRFNYRKSVGLGRSKRNIENKIARLYNFSDLKQNINKELESFEIDEEKKRRISKVIDEKEQENNKIADELRETIAIYQGHATVGKIVSVVLHEGRKPLGYFKNQIPRINDWVEELRFNYSEPVLEKLISRLNSFEEQGNIFIKLFGKIDPLSSKKRERKKDFIVKDVIENVREVFLIELESQNIHYIIDCDATLTCYGWKEDFYITFTNLVDNSIYWLQEIKDKQKEISFRVFVEDDTIVIEYRDNGPGIDKELIESEIIFEPEISRKTGGGTGLGLAISGEAMERNDATLKAIYSTTGAFFKIEVNNQ